MNGQLKGEHEINLFSFDGVKVLSKKITHDGNDAVIIINLDNRLTPGMYYLRIFDPLLNGETLKVMIY
jgi:hypothetical protein